MSTPARPDVVLCLGVPPHVAADLAADVVKDAELLQPMTRGLIAFEQSWGSASWDTAAVVAADLGQLRLATPVLASAGAARRVVVHVVTVPEWRRRLPSRFPPGTTTAGVTDLAHCGRRWTITSDEPTAIWDVVLALRSTERRPAAAGALRIVAGDRGALEWCVDDPQTPTVGNPGRTWRGPRRPFADVVLRTADDDRQRGPAGVPTASVAGRCPPVDPVVANPGDFRREPVGTPATIGEAPATVDLDSPITAADIAALRAVRHLDVTEALRVPAWVEAPLAVAKVLTRLGAAGVPLVTGPLPSEVAALLHDDVVTALQAAEATQTTDPIRREAVAVRQRRAVLRHYSPAAAWAAGRPDLGTPAPPGRTVSVLAVTKRPELVERTVAQAAGQRQVRAEIVLVTHGFEVAAEAVARLHDIAPTLVVRVAAESATLGEALNMAVEAASGEVVSKMDDDDWYGPYHLEDLLQSLDWSGATLVGVTDEFSYLADRDVTVRHPFEPVREHVDTRVAGPSMTIRRDDLRELGGWRPVRVHEDLALNNAVWRAGAVALRTHGLGYLRCRHGRGHTWTTESEHFYEDATESWDGFQPPPELPADDAALSYYGRVRQA